MDAMVPIPASTRPPPGAPVCKVLVVDDHRDTAESLGVALGLLGHDVRAVRSGLAAFYAVTDFAPDACVVDIRMPAMDGFTIAERLRGLLGPGVRMVAVTGERAAASDPRAGVFDRVLTKPLGLGELLGALAAPSAGE